MNTRLRHMDNHQNLDTLAKTVQTNTPDSRSLCTLIVSPVSLCFLSALRTMEADHNGKVRSVSERTVNSSFTCWEMH